MGRLIVLTLTSLLAVFGVQVQTPSDPSPTEPVMDPTVLGQEWMDPLNPLDDWCISMDGINRGFDQVVDAFMAPWVFRSRCPCGGTATRRKTDWTRYASRQPANPAMGR